MPPPSEQPIPHIHGTGCGHLAIVHGDHIGFLESDGQLTCEVRKTVEIHHHLECLRNRTCSVSHQVKCEHNHGLLIDFFSFFGIFGTARRWSNVRPFSVELVYSFTSCVTVSVRHIALPRQLDCDSCAVCFCWLYQALRAAVMFESLTETTSTIW